jgi:hypothetical protein
MTIRPFKFIGLPNHTPMECYAERITVADAQLNTSYISFRDETIKLKPFTLFELILNRIYIRLIPEFTAEAFIVIDLQNDTPYLACKESKTEIISFSDVHRLDKNVLSDKEALEYVLTAGVFVENSNVADLLFDSESLISQLFMVQHLSVPLKKIESAIKEAIDLFLQWHTKNSITASYMQGIAVETQSPVTIEELTSKIVSYFSKNYQTRWSTVKSEYQNKLSAAVHKEFIRINNIRKFLKALSQEKIFPRKGWLTTQLNELNTPRINAVVNEINRVEEVQPSISTLAIENLSKIAVSLFNLQINPDWLYLAKRVIEIQQGLKNCGFRLSDLLTDKLKLKKLLHQEKVQQQKSDLQIFLSRFLRDSSHLKTEERLLHILYSASLQKELLLIPGHKEKILTFVDRITLDDSLDVVTANEFVELQLEVLGYRSSNPFYDYSVRDLLIQAIDKIHAQEREIDIVHRVGMQRDAEPRKKFFI